MIPFMTPVPSLPFPFVPARKAVSRIRGVILPAYALRASTSQSRQEAP